MLCAQVPSANICQHSLVRDLCVLMEAPGASRHAV